RDAGVTEFLAKPISAKALYQRIINVVANPRPFIKTKTYFGPDRRRNTTSNYIGPERRKGGKADVIRQTPLLEKARAPVLQRQYAMSRAKDAAAVVTYGDHEVITPENKLRVAVTKGTPDQNIEDPVARAEKALAELSPQFASWMDAECHRLDQARSDLIEDLTKANVDALFHAAHDIKGQAATFG